jgi:subtilisin-like proprotein convertase family protein
MWQLRPTGIVALGLLVLSSAWSAGQVGRDYEVWEGGSSRVLRLTATDQVVEVDHPGKVLTVRPVVTVPVARRAQVEDAARRYGAASWSTAATGGHYLFYYPSSAAALAAAERMLLDGLEASPSILRQRRGRFTPQDPLWRSQWHLRNTGANRALAGIDLNVVPAWRTVTGRGINIAIVDDGLQVNHPDLRGNVFPLVAEATRSVHYDFNRERSNPSPTGWDRHGTAVAGLVAASANRLGGVGVAPEARLAGLRLTAEVSSDEDEARAFAWRNNRLHIYNNSWGPDDSGSTVEGPGPQAATALRRAALFGRGGRGNIFVWSGGNGGVFDDANYDGYANSRFSIAVGAVSDRGAITTEAEAGCNLLVVAPSSSRMRQGLITTDLSGARGYNVAGANDGFVIPRRNLADRNFTNDFGMTSGSAPLVAGVVALMLEANPRLGWRDVQEILIRSARRVDTRDRGWKRNGAGWWFNDRYGAGLVNAAAAVNLARRWQNLSASTLVRVRQPALNLAVPDGDARGVRVTFDLSRLRNLRVEHVELVVSVSHAWRGDLRYQLNAPSGMSSVVAVRPYDQGRRLRNWRFLSVQHWGESSSGVWTLDVSDRLRGDAGVLESAELIVYGTPILRTGRR